MEKQSIIDELHDYVVHGTGDIFDGSEAPPSGVDDSTLAAYRAASLAISAGVEADTGHHSIAIK
jgi:hypothetical protein